jgi:cobalt-zinc-cadmium efflux system outer membrane protein
MLADALARARQASPSVRIAAADLEAARGRQVQAGLLAANPIVAGDAARHSQPGDAEIDRGVELAQELEVGGQRGLRVAAARHDVARADLVLADRWRAAAAEVRRAFAAVDAAERRRVLAVETAELAHRLATAAHRRARAGDVAELEVRLAEIEETRGAQAITAAESDRARAAVRLAAAIGAAPGEAMSVTSEDAPPQTLPPADELVPRALGARADLAAAREERARLEAEAALVRRRGTVPNVTLRAFYREEVGTEHIAGGGLSVPLPLWNREQGTESALLAAARGAATEVERLEREIPQQVQAAVIRHRGAVQAWTRYRESAVPAADAASALIGSAYAGGYLGLPDVLVQRDRLLQVRTAAIAAWLDLREAEADVLEAVGEEGK